MASMIPAFVDAMQDRALRGSSRDVYVWFHQHLDTVEFRPVKHTVVEVALGMKETTVAEAIERVLACGYVRRGERLGKVWTYRLVYSVDKLTPKAG